MSELEQQKRNNQSEQLAAIAAQVKKMSSAPYSPTAADSMQIWSICESLSYICADDVLVGVRQFYKGFERPTKSELHQTLRALTELQDTLVGFLQE